MESEQGRGLNGCGGYREGEAFWSGHSFREGETCLGGDRKK